MQSFEYPSVSYWSKGINGTHTGGRKKYFFLFAILTTPPWRAHRWNPVDGRPRSLPEVVLGRYSTCAIAYAAYAAASKLTYISQRYTSIGNDLPKISIQSSLRSTKHRRMRRRRLPDPRPIPEGVLEPIYIRKK